MAAKRMDQILLKFVMVGKAFHVLLVSNTPAGEAFSRLLDQLLANDEFMAVDLCTLPAETYSLLEQIAGSGIMAGAHLVEIEDMPEVVISPVRRWRGRVSLEPEQDDAAYGDRGTYIEDSAGVRYVEAPPEQTYREALESTRLGILNVLVKHLMPALNKRARDYPMTGYEVAIKPCLNGHYDLEIEPRRYRSFELLDVELVVKDSSHTIVKG